MREGDAVRNLLLIVAVIIGAPACGRGALPLDLDSAQWIWSRDLATAPSSALFVRDFDLADQPRQAALALRAGDGWIAWVNGRRLAAVVTRDGCEVSELELSPLLRAGANRIVVEVRFDGFFGGVLGCVLVDGACRVPTDGRWRVERRASVELLQGWSRLPDLAAQELGPADLGTSCLGTVVAQSLACGDTPIDLELGRTPEGGALLQLPTEGRLELILPPGMERAVLHVEHESRAGGRETVVLAGTESYLELEPSSPGRLAIHGAPVEAAVLWPWSARCGQIEQARAPLEHEPVGGIRLHHDTP